MKGDFRTLFKRFCLEGSISGTKYFYLYPDPLSRCYWCVATASAVLLAFYLSLVLYVRFQDNPTRVTIENQHASVQNLSYPSITVCSPNQITISSIRHFQKTFVEHDNTTIDVEDVVTQLLGFYEPFTGVEEATMTQLQNLIDLNRYSITEVMSFLPQRCEDFLKLCHFEDEVYRPCGELFVPLLTSHGLCCAFNTKYYFDKKKNREKPKFVPLTVGANPTPVSRALTLVADYNPANAMDGSILNAGGIRIMFTDWKEFPADDVSNVVPTNTETISFVHCTHTYCSADVKLLPQQNRKCNLAHEGSLRFFKEYHNSDCDHLCLASAVEASCGCTPFYMPSLLGRPCNATSVRCIMMVRMNMHKWTGPECNCPGDCESRRYNVDMTIGNLDAVNNLIVDQYPGITFNKSSAIMHFVFHSSVHVKQKQETVMSLISLMSNLGGVFGLCVGVSALSVVEILFFVYVCIKNKVMNSGRQITSRVGSFTD